MRNWSIDTTKFKKKSPEFIKWRLEQLINFGLDDQKLNRKELAKYLEELNIDPAKKYFLRFILKILPKS